jgi:hypothetical protein
MAKGRGEMRMMWCFHEPELEDMLADSIVRAVMDADGVDPHALAATLKETAVLWRAARSKSAAGYRPHQHSKPVSIG